MTHDGSDHLQQMGAILKAISPDDAAKVIFQASFLNSGEGYRVDYFDAQGMRIGPNGLRENPKDALRDLSRLAQDMRSTPIYANDPYTHLSLELQDRAKMVLTVKRIPEWDSWSGLFMRGVSDLSDDELDQFGIPKQDAIALRKKREADPYTP